MARRCLILHGPCDRPAVCGTDGPCGRAPLEKLAARAQISAGPQFNAPPANTLCAACGELGDCDLTTGLCRCCWRAWRWSPIREREVVMP